jgi:protein-tyrosine-phosphatase
MAEALLRHRLRDRAPEVTIGSVGRLFEGEPADRAAVAVLAKRTIDLGDFASRRQSADRVAGTALVVGMERQHVRDLVVLAPDVLARSFTLPEVARRAEVVGARRPGQSLAEWATALGADRDHTDLLTADPDDEIPDPYGGSRRRFRRCAEQIDQHLDTLVALAWPDPTTPAPTRDRD